VLALNGQSNQADGKSVMQMIVLEATEGTLLRITARGEDATAAVERLTALVESGFGEDE
jgi:phosphotransferase system HPr (HPr) family protein